MNKTNVRLRNFWPDGYTGHTDSLGRDIGKEFLESLFLRQKEHEPITVNVQSHFSESQRFFKIRTTINRLLEFSTKNKLSKSKRLHGHLSQEYVFKGNEINVWYTSENLRPPLDKPFDLYLSHDLDPYDDRNIYLPIWVTRLGRNVSEAVESLQTFSSHRTTKLSGKKQICAVISNPEPIRMAFLKQLQRNFAVDVYGAFGLPIIDKS